MTGPLPSLGVTILGVERVEPVKRSIRQFSGSSATHRRSALLYRSGLERDFFMLATKHFGLIDIEYETLRILFRDEAGKNRSYRPDYRISFKHPLKCPKWLNKSGAHCVIYEIKPQARFLSARIETRRAIMAGAVYAASAGLGFQMTFDTEIVAAKAATARNWFDRELRQRVFQLGIKVASGELSCFDEPTLADLVKAVGLIPDTYAHNLDPYAFLTDLFRGELLHQDAP